VNGDATFEGDETFAVNLSSAVNAVVVDGQAQGTIQNDDSQPSLSINDVTVSEGNADAVFVVSLSSPSSQTVTVGLATMNGSATAGSDYQTGTGMITFLPGETTRLPNVPIVNDSLDEPDELFTLNLSAAVNAGISDAQGVGTITDNDPQPTVSINDVTITEGNTGTASAVLTVRLSAASGREVTVLYATASGSGVGQAISQEDYQRTAGTVTFAPGQTARSVTVAINGDAFDEPDETFQVTLPSAVNATIADDTGVVTIRDDDPTAFAVGADAGGGPHVRVFTQDGDDLFSFFAFNPAFTGGVRVAMGDVTGDGTSDIIAAAGPGGGPHVRAFDGRTGLQIPGPLGSFFAYGLSFTGGLFIASADFNNDGLADVVTGADAGGGPDVKVFSGANGALLAGFFDVPLESAGVRVATGDLNGDGTPDIVTASGPGVFPARVAVFDGLTAQPIDGPLGSFVPYPGQFRGGVYVAVGDVNGDGRDDVITGPGAGGGPHVKAFNGQDSALIASFFAYGAAFTGGVRVAAGDVDHDGQVDIITGAGPGGGPHVRAFTMLGGSAVAGFFGFSPVFTGGVFVGGAAASAVSIISPPEQPLTALLGPDAPPVSGSEEAAPLSDASLEDDRDAFFSSDGWLGEDQTALDWALAEVLSGPAVSKRSELADWVVPLNEELRAIGPLIQ
jgi:hypothetical protein